MVMLFEQPQFICVASSIVWCPVREFSTPQSFKNFMETKYQPHHKRGFQQAVGVDRLDSGTFGIL